VVKLDDHGLPTTEFTQVTASSLKTVKEALDEGKMRVAIPLVGFEQPPSPRLPDFIHARSKRARHVKNNPDANNQFFR